MKHNWKGQRYVPFTWERRTPPYATYGVYDNDTDRKIVNGLKTREEAVEKAIELNERSTISNMDVNDED